MSLYIFEKDSLKELAHTNQLFLIDLCNSVRLGLHDILHAIVMRILSVKPVL